MNWAIILGEGRVNFSLLDTDLVTLTVAAGFKELSKPSDSQE